MLIGLDLDGVIIDHTANKIALAKKLGVTLSPSEAASDVIGSYIGEAGKKLMQHTLYDDPAIALTPGLIAGAKEGLDILRARGLEYVLISRRKSAELPIALLRWHELWPRYFDERNAFFVDGTAGKHAKASALGVGVYLDDQASVLNELTSVRNKFLFDPFRAYNNFDGDYKKVYTWLEFIELISKL
ncbi:MAG: hypothetical protein Q7S28_02110 [bacterium]|nr:hypothetical protein [bacterium]